LQTLRGGSLHDSRMPEDNLNRSNPMRAGITALIFAYVLSQFYRSFLAVLTGVLGHDIDATPDDLAAASGLWFLTFAAMQIPVGWALDTIGPRKTAPALLMVGALGTVVFAMATTVWHIKLAMVLIGTGCSAVLMAGYFIFAKIYAPAVFATLGGVMIGIGSLGNLLSAAPTAWAVELFGWRATLMGLAALTAATAVVMFALIRDPAREVNASKGGSVLTLLRMPALWLIFPLMFVNYAAAAGIRGLWVGPYFDDLHGSLSAFIGTAGLVMGLAMVAGTFMYAPADRIFGTRKWVIIIGNSIGVLCLMCLAINPVPQVWTAVILLALIGMAGSGFPVIAAHARSLFPSHLMGRGMTLVNLFGIGGVGIFQMLTGRIYDSFDVQDAYPVIFGLFAVSISIGLVIYAFSEDRTD
jgi:MFS family permease